MNTILLKARNSILYGILGTSSLFAQIDNMTFGYSISLNYGFPQINATVTDQLGFVTEYNSLYSAGFGASIGGVAL